MRKVFTAILTFIAFTFSLSAQSDTTKKESKWYDKISLRGYTQVRYNRLLETNKDLKCEQCDRSWGDNGSIFIRRARLIFSGNVHDRVYIYIQPDLASSASSTNLQFAQIRDAYFDLSLDAAKEFRLRLGQSKIPFGFENMQSSQNRLPLDRADALNSALSNERDLAALFYWAPAETRELFAKVANNKMKGSGDYGVIGFGAFNGQTANRPELNNNLHMVARVSYPLQIAGQIIEPSIQAYSGRVVIADRTSGVTGAREFRDQRIAATINLFPQPFGILAEYNIGRGPEFTTGFRNDSAGNPTILTRSIEEKPLEGGFVTISFKADIAGQTLIPFARAEYYKGGKKHELDARRYVVREYEAGIEWQPFSAFELVAMYTMSDRTFEDGAKISNRQKGNLLRLQAQFNY
ncbi:MAG TPA: porin [Patescibacteria group bacterium]|nr:porin [Patescibacteria group bacterium]